MCTSPELNVHALPNVQLKPLDSPLNASLSSSTSPFRSRRRKLPLRTVVDPTRPSQIADIEQSDRAFDAVQLSPRRRLPLTIGTPDGVKDTPARREIHRPSQSLVSRLGAASPSTFDLSRHSIIPDQMKQTVNNTPLTPKSEARRIRFLDLEDHQPFSNFTRSLVKTAKESSVQPLLLDKESSIASDEDEIVTTQEQENPFTVSDESEDSWSLLERVVQLKPRDEEAEMADSSTVEVEETEGTDQSESVQRANICEKEFGKSNAPSEADSNRSESNDIGLSDNIVPDATNSDSSDSDSSSSSSSDSDDNSDDEEVESGILALVRDRDNSIAQKIKQGTAEQALRPSNKQQTVIQPYHVPANTKSPPSSRSSSTVVSVTSGVWKINAVPSKRPRQAKENLGWKERPIERSSKKRSATASSPWVINRFSPEHRGPSMPSSKKSSKTTLPTLLR